MSEFESRLRGKRLLVIDDDDRVRRYVSRALDVCGCEVTQSSSGPAGVELIDKLPGLLDAVLLDQTMPRLSGLETLSRIRSQAPELPVVLMTGYSSSELHESLKLQKHVAFLQKPFGIDELTAALGSLLS